MTFSNDLPVAAALDCRGLDGVPAAEPLASRAPLATGAKDTFQLPLRHAGTFLCEPLFGDGTAPARPRPLIVTGTSPVAVDRDEVLLIEEWRVRPDGTAIPPGSDPKDSTQIHTINGKTSYDISAPANARLRLRFINGSQRTVLAVKLDNLDVRVMAIDGQPAEPFPARNGALVLAPGSRTDVFVDAADPAGTSFPILLHDGKQARPVFASSQWSNIYRARDVALTESTRPIMASVATAGVVLPPGTYWVDWQTGGTLGSGPWAPAITIAGSTAVGNGLQYNGSAWAALIDTGTAAAQQGLPFQVIGSIGLQPAIVLTKTVGTDPNSCATASTISVPYGSTVYYCYTVTNTGNVTLTDHTLTDDVLGTVLGPDFPYNLVPGASAFVTESYVLMTETITNNALWEAYVIDTGIIATATASATVTGSPTDVTISGIGGQTSSTVVMVGAATGVMLLMGVALYLRRQNQLKSDALLTIGNKKGYSLEYPFFIA